ncbi:MAG: DUF2270 domain-containing protein [Planctomycetota bacterium]
MEWTEIDPQDTNVIMHVYRGEVQRINAWRVRMDRTTNWAIVITVGVITFIFSNPGVPHWTVFPGLILTYVLLFTEARRDRHFDAWRGRVRGEDLYSSGAMTVKEFFCRISGPLGTTTGVVMFAAISTVILASSLYYICFPHKDVAKRTAETQINHEFLTDGYIEEFRETMEEQKRKEQEERKQE